MAKYSPKRIGEEWSADRIRILSAEIEALKQYVVVSGGWAWHYLSPRGHPEWKVHHDHKDLDLFVAPAGVWALMPLLRSRGYEKTWTKYDGKTEGFHRYTKVIQEEGAPVKVMIDLFVERVPSIEVDGVRVVAPAHLLSLYGQKHSSDDCTAVVAARRMLAACISPVGRAELVTR